MSGAWWIGEEELIDEQTSVLELDFNKHLLILGPPGSGKTNLLLLRANHVHIAEQSEFYIVAYTGLLANFIRTGAALYSFPSNKIITQTKLFEMVLSDHGIAVPRLEGENFQDRQDILKQKLKELMKTGKGKHAFPMLFIDEAQDYDQFDLSVFFYLAKTLCFSADARQGIYESDGSNVDWLCEHCGEPIRLKYHFRTGKKILEVADRIMAGKFGHVPMVDTSQYKEDKLASSVDVLSGISLDEQVSQAAARLAVQLKAYPNETLGVLVPRKKTELPAVWKLLSDHPLLAGKVTNAHMPDFDPSRPIWLSTIHSAKGLEFRCVHLIGTEAIAKFNEHARRLAFTAVTRAKTALVIYHYSELLPFLASALATKSEKKIRIGDLFGKKK